MLWHEPFGAYPFSMQLGSANVVSAQTGLKVVSDILNIKARDVQRTLF